MDTIRFYDHAPEVYEVQRAGGTKRVLRGLAAVYYDPSNPGTETKLTAHLWERIAPGAFDRVLRENQQVKASINHDPKDKLLGRTPRTLRLTATARGLEYEVDLPNTSAGNDAWEMVQRGDLAGSSFHADVAADFVREGDKDIYLIREVAKLYELGPVTDGAYTATSATAIMRCHDAWTETRKRIDMLNYFREKLNKDKQ